MKTEIFCMLANKKMNTNAYSFYYFWGFYYAPAFFAMTKHPLCSL